MCYVCQLRVLLAQNTKEILFEMLTSVKEKTKKKEYTFVEKLGHGSFGQCYIAVDIQTNQKYACKVFPDKHATKEIDLHSKLCHTNVVKFITSFNHSNYNCILMELCTNGTIALLLQCRKWLTDPEVRCVATQAVHGIQYLHSNLIIHRDLKLSNLLLTTDMVVKIADFGLSVQLAEPTERRATICGTKRYMAPEVLRGEGHGFEVDIWALGCVVFTLLDGNAPFSSQRTNKQKDFKEKIILSSSRVSVTAKHFLKTIFEPHLSKRPSAHNLLNHEYFKTGVTLKSLSLSSFYKAPISSIAPSVNIKNRALKDKTNQQICQLSTQLKYSNNEKENNYCFSQTKCFSSCSMTLRPRKKVENILKHYLETLPCIDDDGNRCGVTMARNIMCHLIALQNTITQKTSYTILKKQLCHFICVNRWVGGLATSAYHLSDGSMLVHLSSQQQVRRSPEGYLCLYKTGEPVRLLQSNELEGDMKRMMKYIDGFLKNLVWAGPKSSNKLPVYLLARKFFFAESQSAQAYVPTAAFLLSNGSCQMNFSNHDKILINVYDNFVVVWTPEEYRTCSFKDLIRYGIPPQLEQKIEYLCLFLSLTQHCTLQHD